MLNFECQVGWLRYAKTRLCHSVIVVYMEANGLNKASLDTILEVIALKKSLSDNILRNSIVLGQHLIHPKWLLTVCLVQAKNSA